ncbi:MAG: diguanylate cyclase [Thiohalophilus sp.]|uniref:diguanylate cyclase domain-containing protein n=1 Tax=Thiohalophilus sp. TaxID=3028392 RepID=UPI0028708417|nr:diguanylate cyclase [Thiohalophilus sp.]MDR9435625.1 diguanylate cyclase [Thiohalophilus sp.]
MGITDSMKGNPRLRPITRLYLLILVVWFFFVAVLIGFIIDSEVNKYRQQFQRSGDALYDQLGSKVEINEAVIEGFASLLASRSRHEWEQLRHYARRMIKRYPHIHTFEVARHVRLNELSHFVAEMRRNVEPDFRIADFDFNDRRQWRKVARAEHYYPVVFMEPMQTHNRAILGLDLGSVDMFRQALKQSYKQGGSVASPPFTLLEGQQGFLLQRAVARKSEKRPRQYAILVIKTRALLSAMLLEREELTARLSYAATDKDLYYKPGQLAGTLEKWLLPRLQYQRQIDNPGQPFAMTLEQQLRFSDVNLVLIIAILVVAMVSFWSVLGFSRLHHRNEMARLHYENRLYHLANNDSLTGLANRNFLLERLRQVLSRAKRKGTRFALVFMDMNNFKMVNDEFGHAAGDSLLRDIAIRFKSCMREEDTVCRYQGDEFVVLLEEINHRDETEQIRAKLLECLETPFMVNGTEIRVSVSIGVAVFPEDGEDVEALLHVADQKMYREKKGNG